MGVNKGTKIISKFDIMDYLNEIKEIQRKYAEIAGENPKKLLVSRKTFYDIIDTCVMPNDGVLPSINGTLFVMGTQIEIDNYMPDGFLYYPNNNAPEPQMLNPDYFK